MTQSGPKQRRHYQVFLAMLLFLVGQLALALHSYDHGSQSVETEECVVCLVSSSDDSAAIIQSPHTDILFESNRYPAAADVPAIQPLRTSSQPRAPPFS